MGIIACGGGGGGGSEKFFGGVYRVSLLLDENTCGPGFDPSLTLTHTVNQDGTRIVLDSGSAVLTGSVNPEEDGFLVTWEADLQTCDISQAFAYVENTGGESDFAVGFVQTNRCSFIDCEFTYLGVANMI